MYYTYIKTSIGLLMASFDESFSIIKISKVDKCTVYKIPQFALRFIEELKLYFEGKLIKFSYPFTLKDCSEFEKKVLKLTCQIPYGHIVTYNWIAKNLNTSPRAIGQALKRNPLPLLIPCHRVIKSNGTLGGYSLGLESKKWLINHEASILCKLL